MDPGYGYLEVVVLVGPQEAMTIVKVINATAAVINLFFILTSFIFKTQFTGQDFIKSFSMKQFFILLTAFVLIYNYSIAQSAEDSVKAAVNKLFEGMKNSDAGLLKTAFADSAILQTIGRTREGNSFIRNETLDAFAETISKLPKGAADERINFETVKIDGPLAIVWTPYKFYYNGTFSHCGVNSFQLVRINGQWKIQYLIDTRRKERCE